MKRLTYILLFLSLLTSIILAVYIAKDNAGRGSVGFDIPESGQGIVSEITMDVYHDWCEGPECPDYKITFRREGREPYYSTVTRTATRTGLSTQGDLLAHEFEELAQLLQSQGFFSLESVYPQNSGCADCVVVTVIAVRDAQRKRVTHLHSEIPLELWTIQRAIEGTATHVEWLKN